LARKYGKPTARFFGEKPSFIEDIGQKVRKIGYFSRFLMKIGQILGFLSDLKKIWGPKRRCKEDANPMWCKALQVRIQASLGW